MDEILRYPHTAPAPAPAETREAHSWRLPSLTLPKFEFPDALQRRSPLHVAVFLTVALSVATAGIASHVYCPAYRVSVDGVDLGVVSSPESVENAVDRVEARAGSILGREYTLEQNLEFEFQLAPKDELMAVSSVETYLFDQIGEVMKTSVLTVNGKMLGAADNHQALTAMLESIKAPYVTENTVSAEFVEPVVVTREYTATTALREISALRETLTANSMERVDYNVQPGDTFSGIANSHGMTVEELQLLNPGVDINKLWIDQTLTISQAVPFLSVRTLDNVTYDGPVAFAVEEVPDDTIYQGYSKVLTPGVEGWATYNADVSYLNGVEQSRTINSADVHVQPVTQVVAVGTKPRPKTMATGQFQWPLYGRINSSYGSRYIFGSYSFHTGLDIAGSYGASIAAADGGRVTFAGTGTGSYWSYGNYVVIDHENGLQTIYAHCSSLCVSTGERVYKGQVIAKVGSTGRATGNHCHFQVKENGETVNPYNYLP
ncbi:M23 family metallopeptidase [Vermiculatibacterium agrestimuris]|uniref:M23 family metallopeptidase n=1 Tax=Vermiculatibacterium agrestimuris TaxID=2941519 RepID=UPI00203E135E|nr:M23 family metallopeptidase [Vermiculatibacterium agrestimuris]